MIISSVWTDLAKKKIIKQFLGTIKEEKFYKKFKKQVVGAKIVSVKRRAKNILTLFIFADKFKDGFYHTTIKCPSLRPNDFT